MKAAKRKRAAAAPVRATADAVQDAAAVVAEHAMPAVQAEVTPPAAEPVQLSTPAAVATEPEAAAAAPSVALPAEEIPVAVIASVEVPSEPSPAAVQPVVTLSSNCTVKDANALRQSLRAVLDSEAAVTLDVSGVERIDTATMQVLCAFVRERVADARAVIWLGVPVALRDAAGLLGVRELLMLPFEAGATT